MKGLSTDVTDGGCYDVIVVGGGPGGVPAAIAAARQGAKVLLLQNRPMLGGNSSDECGVTMDGAEAYHTYARETGIAEEIRRLRDLDPSFVGDYTRAMEKLVAAEKNITVLCDRHVCGAQMEGNAIGRVEAFHVRNLTRERFTGKVFLDCTGDGWLGYYAGAKYRFGREAAWQHKESIAEQIADLWTMSGCLKAGNRPFFQEVEEPTTYHAPAWVPVLPMDEKEFGRVIMSNGARMYWWLETHNSFDDLWDGEEARDELFLVVLAYYDHLKNRWRKKERAAKVQLKFPSVFNGRRESRRLIGDYILTQDDCVEGHTFPDAISYAGWHLDIHHPEGLFSGEKGPMHCAQHVPMSQIPYRCLYSANIDNLLMAGRNISVTHLALGCTRVANTIATLGQAAGTAAAMCVQLDETPRGIYQRHMKQLQQTLLANDQYIPGLKKEDPNDPCLTATAEASSVKTDEVFQALQGNDGELSPLEGVHSLVFCAQSTKGDIHRIFVKLHSSNQEPTAITMHAYTMGTGQYSYAPPGETVTAQAQVPPMGEYWVEVPIHIPIPVNPVIDRCFCTMSLDPAPGISWRQVNDLSFYDTSYIYPPEGKRTVRTAQSFRYSLECPEEALADCGPANVINGHSRILDKDRYEWVSDPAQALPQWIQLNFRESTGINSISVVFDTDITNPGTCWHPGSKSNIGVPACVKDYRVAVFTDGSWQEVAKVEGNIMRKRTHTFAPVTAEKLRVLVDSTWGDPSARIMEISAGSYRLDSQE